ncbi:MAG: hypothetical protein JO144_07820 [Actinobacteria bacterium]|nr:hypothetical protein [Actinomycetota bacterium]
MQLSTTHSSRRPSAPLGTVWRLAATLLVALLMVMGHQATASAGVAPQERSAALTGFTVSISGPTVLNEFDDATYTAVPSGGTAPYTYTWYYNSGAAGTGSTFSVHLVRASFTLQVTAKDARGVTVASAVLSVQVVREPCRTC